MVGSCVWSWHAKTPPPEINNLPFFGKSLCSNTKSTGRLGKLIFCVVVLFRCFNPRSKCGSCPILSRSIVGSGIVRSNPWHPTSIVIPHRHKYSLRSELAIKSPFWYPHSCIAKILLAIDPGLPLVILQTDSSSRWCLAISRSSPSFIPLLLSLRLIIFLRSLRDSFYSRLVPLLQNEIRPTAARR